MVDTTDLDAAVRKGIITPDAASALRNLAADRRAAPAADEERFGLLTGAADFMAAVGIVLFNGFLMSIIGGTSPLLAFVVTALCWLQAEYFTRKRQLTLASIALFVIAALATGAACAALALMTVNGTHGDVVREMQPHVMHPGRNLVISVGMGIICYAWWLRFHLPIAIAGVAVTIVMTTLHLLRLIVPDVDVQSLAVVVLSLGLVMFALAVYWDLTDVRRETIRSDVAFWLHLVAGATIARWTYVLLFGTEEKLAGWYSLYTGTVSLPGPSIGLLGVMVFMGFVLVSIIINRRSLMLSGMVYGVPALAVVLSPTSNDGAPVAIMLAGAGLLLLSALWRPIRQQLLRVLPIAIRAQLPRTDMHTKGLRPIV